MTRDMEWLGLVRPAVAIVLLIGALAKLHAVRRAPETLSPVGFRGRFIPPRAFWASVAVSELALAGLLIVEPRVGAALTVTFFAGAGAYTLAHANSSSFTCGCFGVQGNFAAFALAGRAVLLALLACASMRGRPVAQSAHDPFAWLALLLAVGAFFALSPDLRGAFAQWARRRVTSACVGAPVAPDTLVAYLEGTRVWSQLRPYLLDETPNDTWADGCARHLTFPARFEEAHATVLLSVYLATIRPFCAGAVRRGITGPIVIATDPEYFRFGVRRRLSPWTRSFA